MGKCIKCGVNFIGTPETPVPDHLCKSCTIEDLRDYVRKIHQLTKHLKEKGEMLFDWDAVIEQSEKLIPDLKGE